MVKIYSKISQNNLGVAQYTFRIPCIMYVSINDMGLFCMVGLVVGEEKTHDYKWVWGTGGMVRFRFCGKIYTVPQFFQVF